MAHFFAPARWSWDAAGDRDLWGRDCKRAKGGGLPWIVIGIAIACLFRERD